MALITKSEAARRIGRTPGRIHQLIKQGRIKVHVDAYGKEKLDEREVEQMRCYMDQGIVRGRKPRKPSGGAALATLAKRPNADWSVSEPELQPVEPEPYQPPPPQYHQPPVEHRPVPARKRASELTEDDLGLFDDEGRLDPVRCRAWQEFEKARKLQAERYAAEGKYVEVAKVKPAVERAMATIRKGVMAVPSRLKAMYAELTIEQMADLERLCRETLDKVVIDYTQDANS